MFEQSREIKKAFLFINILVLIYSGVDAATLILNPFVQKDLGLSLTQIGILSSLPGLIGILVTIPATLLTLSVGTIPLLLIATISLGFFLIPISLASSFWILLFIHVLKNVMSRFFYPVAQIFIGNHAEKSKRGERFSNFYVASDIGKIVLSSILTSLIVYISWRNIFQLGALITIILTVGAVILLKIKIQPLQEKSDKKKEHISWKKVFTDRNYLLLLLISFLDSVSASVTFIYLPFLLLFKGIAPQVLVVFTGIYFIGYLTGRFLLGRMADRYNKAVLFFIIELIMAMLITGLVLSSSVILLGVLSLLLGMVTRGTSPIRQAIVAEVADTIGSHEKAFSTNSIASTMGGLVAPIIIGVVSDMFGLLSAFYLIAMVTVFAALPALFLNIPKMRHTENIPESIL